MGAQLSFEMGLDTRLLKEALTSNLKDFGRFEQEAGAAGRGWVRNLTRALRLGRRDLAMAGGFLGATIGDQLGETVAKGAVARTITGAITTGMMGMMLSNNNPIIGVASALAGVIALTIGRAIDVAAGVKKLSKEFYLGTAEAKWLFYVLERDGAKAQTTFATLLKSVEDFRRGVKDPIRLGVSFDPLKTPSETIKEWVDKAGTLAEGPRAAFVASTFGTQEGYRMGISQTKARDAEEKKRNEIREKAKAITRTRTLGHLAPLSVPTLQEMTKLEDYEKRWKKADETTDKKIARKNLTADLKELGDLAESGKDEEFMTRVSGERETADKVKMIQAELLSEQEKLTETSAARKLDSFEKSFKRENVLARMLYQEQNRLAEEQSTLAKRIREERVKGMTDEDKLVELRAQMGDATLDAAEKLKAQNQYSNALLRIEEKRLTAEEEIARAKDQQLSIERAQKHLSDARLDRGKVTLDELADPNFVPLNRSQANLAFAAQRIDYLEKLAKDATTSGNADLAERALTERDRVQGLAGIPYRDRQGFVREGPGLSEALKSGEVDPQQQEREALASQEKQGAAMARKADLDKKRGVSEEESNRKAAQAAILEEQGVGRPSVVPPTPTVGPSELKKMRERLSGPQGDEEARQRRVDNIRQAVGREIRNSSAWDKIHDKDSAYSIDRAILKQLQEGIKVEVRSAS